MWFQCLTIAGGFSYFSGQWAAGWEFEVTDFDGNRRADVLLYNPSSGAWSRAVNIGAGAFQYVSGVWETNLTLVVSL